jgi:hypothetical protein
MPQLITLSTGLNFREYYRDFVKKKRWNFAFLDGRGVREYSERLNNEKLINDY